VEEISSRERSRCSVDAADEWAARIRDEPGACARAHPWDLESSGLCRERAEELGRLAREVGESVPEAPPPRTPPYFFARGRRSASGAHFCPLPSLRALALLRNSLKRRKRTEGDAFIIRFRLVRFPQSRGRRVNDDCTTARLSAR
jgi:hypothetical protein